MSKYIDREWLITKLTEFEEEKPHRHFSIPDIVYVLCNCPTVDVAEVCRCKDCKYIDVVTCPITGTERLYCDFGTQPVYVRDSHFCSYGERKEGVENDL